MLSISRRKWGVKFHDVFFAQDPRHNLQDSHFTHFSQASTLLDGFVPCSTKIVSLRNNEGSLFNALSSNTRYKIRRAEREGIEVSHTCNPSHDEITKFRDFFNSFADLKGRPHCNTDKLAGLRDASSLIFTYAANDQRSRLVAHAYIADKNLGRLRLLYSASLFRSTQNTQERNYIGRANRFLHWQDMLMAKNVGFYLYDLGGFPINHSDPEKNAIARFKNEFGGELVTEYSGFFSRYNLLRYSMPLIQRMIA